MTPMKLLFSVVATSAALACVQASNLFTAYSMHTDTVCTSVPQQVAYVASADCTTANMCATQAEGSKQRYMHQDCTTDCVKRTNTLFAGSPWVQLEIHTPGSSCGQVVSTVAYLADGSCLVTDNSSSSIIAAVYPNKSASILTYNGNECAGNPIKTNILQASDLQKSKCISNLFLVQVSDATIPVAVQSHNSAPVQAVVSWLLVTIVFMIASLA